MPERKEQNLEMLFDFRKDLFNKMHQVANIYDVSMCVVLIFLIYICSSTFFAIALFAHMISIFLSMEAYEDQIDLVDEEIEQVNDDEEVEPRQTKLNIIIFSVNIIVLCLMCVGILLNSI